MKIEYLYTIHAENEGGGLMGPIQRGKRRRGNRRRLVTRVQKIMGVRNHFLGSGNGLGQVTTPEGGWNTRGALLDVVGKGRIRVGRLMNLTAKNCIMGATLIAIPSRGLRNGLRTRHTLEHGTTSAKRKGAHDVARLRAGAGASQHSGHDGQILWLDDKMFGKIEKLSKEEVARAVVTVEQSMCVMWRTLTTASTFGEYKV